jgi:hypothetical protein
MWILENDIPYFPATVWHDPAGNVAWTNPIQFFANGTLPIDIYWDPAVVYRLEFRQHLNPLTPPTQADPLIYLVENYQVGSGGINPNIFGIATENQISNPQFEAVLFGLPIVLTSVTDQSIEIAPGWVLNTFGTGNITVDRIALNNLLINPSNAPYALHLTLSGFNSANINQRFNQNGMLWTSTAGHTRFVASALTARAVASAPVVSAQIVDSDGNTLGTVLSNTVLSGAFNEYTGSGQMAATTNTDTPPAAWIEYQLLLPGTIDVYLTSFQLIQTESAAQFPFIEDSIERQIDHLFHYYKPQLAFKPIKSYLVGWDFPLNPAQALGRSPPIGPFATGNNKGYYTWDQTILFQTLSNSIATLDEVAGNGAMVLGMALAGQAAIMQYLPNPMCREILLGRFCTNIIAGYTGTAPAGITVTMWYTTNGAVPTLTNTFFTGLDANGVPTGITAGWFQVPRDTLGNATLPALASAYTNYQLSGWALNNETAALSANFFAIVIGSSALPINASLGFLSVSLNAGDIPTIPAPQTPGEVLLDCQFYFQKSFIPGVTPNAAVGQGKGESFGVQYTVSPNPSAGPFVRFATPMRKSPDPTTGVILYNPINNNTQITTPGVGDWSGSTPANVNAYGFFPTGVPNGGGGLGNLCIVNWTADARLGIV